MTIRTQCSECGREYKMRDERAGSTVACKDCGSTIHVPRNNHGDSTFEVNGLMKGIGLGVGAVVVLALMGGLAGNKANRIANAVQQVANTAMKQVNMQEQPSSEDSASRDEAYRLSLQNQRSNHFESQRRALEQSFGAHNVVTIKFTDVIGDSELATNYLHRKVFRAAYKYHEAGRSEAARQTEQNRKNAEQQAIQQHNSERKSSFPYGPMAIQYFYQGVESSIPYPKIVFAGQVGNVYTYYAAPAPNPNEFATNVGVGTSSISDRVITISAKLPNPIPDPDVEEMYIKHGTDKVVKLHVTDARGEPASIKMYLSIEVAKADLSGQLVIVGFKQLGPGNYEFYVGPVQDARLFAANLSWGEFVDFEPRERVLVLKANLPATLPTEAEMKAAQQDERQRLDAIRHADWNHTPRPGESELDWALRTLKLNNVWGVPKALKALAVMAVEEERREEVSHILCINLGESNFDPSKALPAMMNWRTDETEKAILRLGGSRLSGQDRTETMNALVQIGTPACAEALASGLPDWHSGDDCVRYLVQMGPIAEEPVLRYIKHQDSKVRGRVYSILMDIGTSSSLSLLRSNISLEQTPVMKTVAKECYDRIKERTQNAEAEEKPKVNPPPSTRPGVQ